VKIFSETKKTEPTTFTNPRRCKTIKAIFLYACSGDLFCHKLRIVCGQIYFLDRGKAQAGVRSWGEIQSRFPAELLPKNEKNFTIKGAVS
jgi:hypothetical protein